MSVHGEDQAGWLVVCVVADHLVMRWMAATSEFMCALLQ